MRSEIHHPAPFIYINGFPGVGKFTVAKELQRLIPDSKLVDNHLLIDPCAAIFDREMQEYQPLRKTIRESVLEAIATSTSHADKVWIFTDSQTCDPLDCTVAEAYRNAATKRMSAFISVVLKCTQKENTRRLRADDRLPSISDEKAKSAFGKKSKLTDVNILKDMRMTDRIYRFGGDNEIELDNTNMSADEVAQKVWSFAQSSLRRHQRASDH